MSPLSFDKDKKSQKKIEITIQVRDKNGKPTGKTKTFGSDTVSEISTWYDKQKPRKKRKRKREDKK